MFNPCVIIPVFDHEHAIGAVVADVLGHGLPVLLVDDGCSAGCAAVLDSLAAATPDRVTLLRHVHNLGKGAAVLSGFAKASQEGFTHLLQIDADGQHCLGDIPRFLKAALAHPAAVIAGCPIYDESVPALRLYARYLTHILVWINTMSFAIKDSMCGFRLYPVAPVIALMASEPIGRRMNFDTEILVRLQWRGITVVNLPTRVTYPSDGVSHFRMWGDNVLITWMHIRLFGGMLVRLPRLLARHWSQS